MSTIITPAPAYQKPSGKLYLSVSQLNLVNNTLTLVELNSIYTGFTDGIEDTTLHRITPGCAGFYFINGQATFMNVVAAKNYEAAIRVSGVSWVSFCYGWAGGGTLFSVPVSSLVKLSATDYIELWVRSQSGDNTVDLSGVRYRTYLSVQRVR